MKSRTLYKILPLAIGLFFFGCASSTETAKTEVKNDNYQWLNTDTIKAGRFDTGKMWTFEYPPVDYFKEAYNFTPDTVWLDNARLAALRFATYCSASFVSASGLVMTNNHCARESITEVQLEGEDLNAVGFFAETPQDERQVPGLFVDQLVLVRDVTGEINDAAAGGKDNDEREVFIQTKISEIETRVKDSTGLEISVTELFNGAKYSLYGYKRYNDVRLVFAPETQLGYFGGDADNFTYPRYNLDCTFFRVYDEGGNPLKTEHYFSWSENGPVEGDAVFVIGNPANTSRLNTVAQLEFNRDIEYPRFVKVLQDQADIYSALIEQRPESKDELQNELYSFSNSVKAYNGIIDGLRDPVLMAKKRDFENNFRKAVQTDPDLQKEYGNIWKGIEEEKEEYRTFSNELFVLYPNSLTTSEYFFIAWEIIDLAEELRLPEEERSIEYQGDALDTAVYYMMPDDFDHTYQQMLLEKQIENMYTLLGPDYPLLKKITGGRRGKEAVQYMLNNSFLTSYEKLNAQVKKGAEALLNSEDPFIYFIRESKERRNELAVRASDIRAGESAGNRELGKALYEVYGTTIAPDATFTLRIADGIVTGFPYNGTIAPPITTFYGMYDRYYSFNKEFPFNLPQRWIDPPAEFDLSTPFNFVSTNDIIGGNSGSPVINTKREIVGLAFDGNIQSLPGSFIFTPEVNRCVSVHSEGMIEAIRNLYKAVRLADELEEGSLITNPGSK